MEILQEIGAYAGLAAVVGLAVLSALYFSQARDVKRLREWAGRAPERTADQIARDVGAPKVVAQPKPGAQPKPAAQPAGQKTAPGQPVPKPVPAQPGGPKPAPAPAAAAGAGPATAKPGAATPAGQRQGPAPPADAKPGDAKPGETKPDEPAKPGAPVPAGADSGEEGKPAKPEEGAPPTEAVPAEAGATAGDEVKVARAGEPVATSAGGDGEAAEGEAAPEREPAPVAQAGTAAPTRPGGPAQAAAPPAGETGEATPPGPSTVRRIPPAATPGAGGRPPRAPTARTRPLPGRPGARPSETAILPPYEEVREGGPPRGGLLRNPRYLLLAVAGTLIVGGAAAFGLAQLGKEEAPSPSDERVNEAGEPTPKKRSAAVNPGDVTVAVLNGTTIPGLAAQIGDKVEGFGFNLGNVQNNPDQQRAESVVLYAEGAEREAAAVGRRLGVAQREPIDPQSQAIGGDATVVVIAGADQTQ
jgi:LytR cell envelope-related transcriptional attenuator